VLRYPFLQRSDVDGLAHPSRHGLN
jgi:hypothetical protein